MWFSVYRGSTMAAKPSDSEQGRLAFCTSKIRDQLKCSVCLEQYTLPKTLPCHHSFCLGCIERFPIELQVIYGNIIIIYV